MNSTKTQHKRFQANIFYSETICEVTRAFIYFLLLGFDLCRQVVDIIIGHSGWSDRVLWQEKTNTKIRSLVALDTLDTVKQSHPIIHTNQYWQGKPYLEKIQLICKAFSKVHVNLKETKMLFSVCTNWCWDINVFFTATFSLKQQHELKLSCHFLNMIQMVSDAEQKHQICFLDTKGYYCALQVSHALTPLATLPVCGHTSSIMGSSSSPLAILIWAERGKNRWKRRWAAASRSQRSNLETKKC